MLIKEILTMMVDEMSASHQSNHHHIILHMIRHVQHVQIMMVMVYVMREISVLTLLVMQIITDALYKKLSLDIQLDHALLCDEILIMTEFVTTAIVVRICLEHMNCMDVQVSMIAPYLYMGMVDHYDRKQVVVPQRVDMNAKPVLFQMLLVDAR